MSRIGISAVCEEAPVELFVSSKTLVTFMCTPQNPGELAIGYLYSCGLITGLEDILSNGACEDIRLFNKVLSDDDELIGERLRTLSRILKEMGY